MQPCTGLPGAAPQAYYAGRGPSAAQVVQFTPAPKQQFAGSAQGNEGNTRAGRSAGSNFLMLLGIACDGCAIVGGGIAVGAVLLIRRLTSIIPGPIRNLARHIPILGPLLFPKGE